jgi:hypothetical protein
MMELYLHAPIRLHCIVLRVLLFVLNFRQYIAWGSGEALWTPLCAQFLSAVFVQQGNITRS